MKFSCISFVELAKIQFPLNSTILYILSIVAIFGLYAIFPFYYFTIYLLFGIQTYYFFIIYLLTSKAFRSGKYNLSHESIILSHTFSYFYLTFSLFYFSNHKVSQNENTRNLKSSLFHIVFQSQECINDTNYMKMEHNR